MLKKLIFNNKIEILIFLFIWLSRLIVADYSNSFHSVDVGNYILAVFDYDISADRPHMPGYFLYVYFFKFLNLFFENGNALFVVGQSFFQAVSSIFIYKIIKDKFELKYNIAILVLIYSIPMIYLYGIMSEIYSVDILTISVFLYLIHKDKISFMLPILGVIFGIRQSSGIFLLPAIIYFYFYEFKFNNYKFKDLLLSIGIFTIICLMWFIPLTLSTGGIFNYFKLLSIQNNYVVGVKFINNLISFITYSIFYFIPILILFIFSKRISKLDINKINISYLLIIIPQLLFYSLYHYNKGYALLLIPAIILFIVFNFNVKRKLLIIISCLNLLVFFLLPGNIPSYNTQIKREFRNIDVKQVWFERFQYWWMPSLGSHNVSVVLHNDIENNSEKIYKLVQDNPLILNNTLVVRGRNLSYILQKAVIIERTYETFESYDRHYNLKSFTKHEDISKLIINSFVLVDKEYFKKYLTNISTIKLETEYYYIIKVNEMFLSDFLNLDYSHFSYK